LNKHGEQNFRFEIVQECKTIEEALQLEQTIINEHFGKDYFYNLSMYAVLPSEEVKLKLRRIANKKPIFSSASLLKCKENGIKGAQKRWSTITNEQRKAFKLKMIDAAKRGIQNSSKRGKIDFL
jgi:hypothetical protein